MKEKEIQLHIPALRPSNGRIVLQIETTEKFIKNVGTNILVPKHLQKKGSTDNRSTENPDAEADYYVVAFAPEVREQLKIHLYNFVDPVKHPDSKKREALEKETVGIEIGDQIILSSYFETIKYNEGKNVYGLIHWQDIIGIIKAGK